MGLIVQEGSKLIKGIKFTSDLPEKNANGRYPVIDLEVWRDKAEDRKTARIRHSFFEKEVAAPTVFHSKAAYVWRSKIVMLSEEWRRRLRNLDSHHRREEIVEVVRKFATKMATSGYDNATRWQILQSVIIKH